MFCEPAEILTGQIRLATAQQRLAAALEEVTILQEETGDQSAAVQRAHQAGFTTSPLSLQHGDTDSRKFGCVRQLVG